MNEIARPALEGSVAVRDGRRLSFAEYGDPHGPATVWMHGTPGGKRQIPQHARAFAVERGLRLICLDRPGIGTSTPHLADDLIDWCEDLSIVLDVLGIDETRVVGLSGGGPYALAAGAALGDRVAGIGILGGVAPLAGPDAIEGGLMTLAKMFAPVLPYVRVPGGLAMSRIVQLVKSAGPTILNTYARFQPEGDKTLLAQSDFKAMFLDDLIHGSRFQFSAPLTDLVLLTRDWGFRLADVSQHVDWWHGSDDHIVPASHGAHVVARLPDATYYEADGHAHLGGLTLAVEVLETIRAQPRPVRRTKKSK